LIEQDHRSIKLRLGPMLGFKKFRRATTTIAGIESYNETARPFEWTASEVHQKRLKPSFAIQ
jgi:transposase-like protein